MTTRGNCSFSASLVSHQNHDFYHKIVFIENYDICVGRYLVEGVDIWLNNPLRPNEASGTSGNESGSERSPQSQ